MWQDDLVSTLSRICPTARIEVYGSAATASRIDGWSDLDLRVHLDAAVGLEDAFDARLWSWQESFDGESQRLRVVLIDGRRIDLTVAGAVFGLPAAPRDNEVRFDAALAAVSLGRGKLLIGMHLLLGICRAALVEVMLLVDRDSGTTHHRTGSAYDERVLAVQRLLTEPPHPERALDACVLYAHWRSEREAGYEPDWRGLSAVLDLGLRR